MKAVVSATIFCNLATLPREAMSDAVTSRLPVEPLGGYAKNEKMTEDHDSNGWPQTPRNRALRSLRSCLAVHIAGDQHLGSTIQYGIDAHRDGPFAICTPAISNIFPRRWYPPQPGENRKPNEANYTGDFLDGFGNHVTVHAIANPQRPQPNLTAADAPIPMAVPAVVNAEAEAKTEKEMKKYTELMAGTDVSFDMIPIPAGKFTMGSPVDEKGRKADEGPQHEVTISPFWMGKCEVSWDEYDIWSFNLDVKRREVEKIAVTGRDKVSDAVTRPTKPYTDMTFGMGHGSYPAICMTQLAAKTYCEWLSAKTGRYYRLADVPGDRRREAS